MNLFVCYLICVRAATWIPISRFNYFLHISYLFFIYAGSKLLIRELPSILDGSARVKAKPQDDSKATLAPKVDFSDFLCSTGIQHLVC